MMHRGYCGIDCSICPYYIAYHTDDDQLRAEVAKKYSTADKIIKADDINCAGCKATTGKLFDFCSECGIRLCAQTRQLDDCSHCSELPCSKVTKMVEFMGSDEPLQVLYRLRDERDKK
jgi:hypothetical protein